MLEDRGTRPKKRRRCGTQSAQTMAEYPSESSDGLFVGVENLPSSPARHAPSFPVRGDEPRDSVIALSNWTTQRHSAAALCERLDKPKGIQGTNTTISWNCISSTAETDFPEEYDSVHHTCVRKPKDHVEIKLPPLVIDVDVTRAQLTPSCRLTKSWRYARMPKRFRDSADEYDTFHRCRLCSPGTNRRPSKTQK